jgi:hypothetical protein
MQERKKGNSYSEKNVDIKIEEEKFYLFFFKKVIYDFF